jgi:hypothetical protein
MNEFGHSQTASVASVVSSWAKVIAFLVIAAALAMLAVDNKPHPFKPAGPLGTIQAVTLTNGQVFYGTLQAEKNDALILVDVFDVQSSVNAQTNQRTVQLNRRRTGDWHAPLDMAIPLDRILFTESVGKESRVANAMVQANTPPAPAPSPPPVEPEPAKK